MRDKLSDMIALMTEAEIIPDQVLAIKELWDRLAESELIISVIGQFKRGKTTLVNAILKDELLPVGIVPLTSAVTQIRNGDAFRAVVHFRDGSFHEAARAELPSFISEVENRNNHKGVEWVELWYPCPMLEQNVTLVDTPGVGSMHQHNTDASYSFVQKSDAVLFMLSVDSPINELEREFLLQAKRYASKFFFVVNKIDTISSDDTAEYLAYCADVLRGILETESVELHPISALTGEGVTEVLDIIRRDISSSADQILESSIQIKAQEVLREALSKMDLFSSAIALPVEALQERAGALAARQHELDAMADETELLLKRRTEKLVEQIDQSLSAQLPAICESVRRKLQAAYDDAREARPRKLEQVLSQVLESTLRAELEQLNEYGLSALQIGYGEIVADLNARMREIKEHVGKMVEEFFAVSYRFETREYSVSERSDFFFRINHTFGTYFVGMDELWYLLPRRISNPKIYRRVVSQMEHDLLPNKNNMVYDYRYKMQESLRTLCAGFRSDVVATQSDISQLLQHAEECVRAEGELAAKQADKMERIRTALLALANELGQGKHQRHHCC